MKIVEPEVSVVFFHPDNQMGQEQFIEWVARNCYQSEDKISDGSDVKLIRKMKKRGHHAMLEFGYAVARIVADRGLTHELVRHRLASFAQESTRYCNYSKGKFNTEITVVAQPGVPAEGTLAYEVWRTAMEHAEQFYLELLEHGVKPEHARSVLPIGLKSEIVIGANLREWRHIFKMRCDTPAHPIIRGVMLQVLEKFNAEMPSLYEDQAAEFLS